MSLLRYRDHVAKKIEILESADEYSTSDSHRECLWWYKKQLREIDEFSNAGNIKPAAASQAAGDGK